MKFYQYLEDHVTLIAFSCIWMIIQSCILYFFSVPFLILIVLAFIWMVLLVGYILLSYMKKCRYMNQLLALVDKLDQKYLLYEVMPKQGRAEDMFYRSILRQGNKSMLEHVSRIKRERVDYQEYVEQWVHEIKTPLAALRLWCENSSDKRRRLMMHQLERTQHYVDQALFYARSETVEKDFQIASTSLIHCIQEALLECKYGCMEAHIHIEVPQVDEMVYADEKWLIFILVQVIDNAIKYRSQTQPTLSLRIYKEHKVTYLAVTDNGIGIPATDLARIFEKGFTGDNGRFANTHATGIGLYLCQRLAKRMNITLQVQSEVKAGTTIQLLF